ncbi:MAG: 4,5-DOPA dioxygenase extradiol [Bacteroidota bacterium]
MHRRIFLKTITLLPLAGVAMKLEAIGNSNSDQQNGKPMPVLFIGHGSPMNAIEDNEFTESWKTLGSEIPRPKAILTISAHWETKGTFITAMDHPKTIHDFFGFPEKLFAVQYPAFGDAKLAGEVHDHSGIPKIEMDNTWGLDHGTWSILTRMFPKADIPVLQLSLDHSLLPEEHYWLAKQIKQLRNQGVLIMGSGNMIHNLRMIDWRNTNGGHPWAEAANLKFKKLISARDFLKLMHYDTLGEEIRLSVPTPEHFLPLLYVLALAEEDETISFFNDRCVYGSLSMTSVKINS